MKLLAIIGANADFSFDHSLAKYIAKGHGNKAEIKVTEINVLPLFNRESPGNKNVVEWHEEIKTADGIILTTPEYDHAIPTVLKSAPEWLGLHARADLIYMKPTMIVGISCGMMGATHAQEETREILLAPDVSASVLPGDEVLIGRAADNLDKATGDLTNQTCTDQLDTVMDNFTKSVVQNQGQDAL